MAYGLNRLDGKMTSNLYEKDNRWPLHWIVDTTLACVIRIAEELWLDTREFCLLFYVGMRILIDNGLNHLYML